MGIHDVNKKKKKKKKKKTKNATRRRMRRCKRNGFDRIAKDVLVEVLVRVAGSSCTDFFNARASCRQLRNASLEGEDYILKHINVSRFTSPQARDTEAAASFLERCRQCGNLEALFQEGMSRLFCPENPDTELQILKRAASEGHAVARYMLGIIYILYLDGFEEEGLTMLFGLSREVNVIRHYRRTVSEIIRKQWKVRFVFQLQEDREQTLRKNDCKVCKLLNANARENPSPPKPNPWILTNWENEQDFQSRCDRCFWFREGIGFRGLIKFGAFDSL